MRQTPVSTFKRMVYAFYCSTDEDSIFYENLHFKLLERYINIFDEVIFCITINDINDIDTIKRIEKRVLSIRNGDVIFKIYENTNYRETFVYYNEIFLKMKELNGLTFFAHSKGRGEMESIEEIINFIAGAYFFSLEKIDDVGKYPFYGSFKMVNNSPMKHKGLKYMWFYVGTFFWGDYQRIYKEKSKFLPKFSSRWFNEMLPGELYWPEECGSYSDGFVAGKMFNAFHLLNEVYGKTPLIKDFYFLYNNLLNTFIK
jgi:hypothetical protein